MPQVQRRSGNNDSCASGTVEAPKNYRIDVKEGRNGEKDSGTTSALGFRIFIEMWINQSLKLD